MRDNRVKWDAPQSALPSRHVVPRCVSSTDRQGLTILGCGRRARGRRALYLAR
jgi:hypothetical protein